MLNEDLDAKGEATASSNETIDERIVTKGEAQVETLTKKQRGSHNSIDRNVYIESHSAVSNINYCDERVDNELQRTLSGCTGISVDEQGAFVFTIESDDDTECRLASIDRLDTIKRNHVLDSHRDYWDERVDNELQRTMTDYTGLSVDEKGTFVFTMESDDEQEYTLESMNRLDTIKRNNSINSHSAESDISYWDQRVYNELQRTMTDWLGTSESDDEQEYSLGSSGSECSVEASTASESVTSADESTTSYAIEVRLQAKAADYLYKKKIENDLRVVHDEACKNLKNSKVEQTLEGFENILNSLVAEFGEGHKRTATALHNLAVVHLRMGNFEDAVESIEVAIKMRKELFGEDHYRVADSLMELGIILLAQEKFEESLDTLYEAFDIREKELVETPENEQGNVKLQIANILNNIGCVNFEYGEMDKAKVLFQEVLDIQRSCYEEGNFKSMPGFLAISCTICNIGFCDMENANFKGAIYHLEDALKIQQNVLEPSSSVVIKTIEIIAYAYVKYGGIDKALKYYSNMYDIIEASYNEYDIKLASTLKKKAYCEIKLFQYEKASKTLERLQLILTNNLDPIDTQLYELGNLVETVHNHINKSSSFSEFISKVMTSKGYRIPWNSDLLWKCGYDVENDDEMNIEIIQPSAPLLKTKMSGHKLTFA